MVMDEFEKDEQVQTIRLKRHLWPDEVELKQQKAKVKRLRICLVAGVIMALVLGWLGGSVFPVLASSGSSIPISQVLSSSDKISAVLEIMESEWFFGSEIEDLNTRLENQALDGITTNEEDPHTDYMSAEEMESFTQSINRNFVGIGVEFSSENGINMVKRVFKNSPADKAGVQAGDIIHIVDGTLADGLNASEVKELVTGEEGTPVKIEFIRQGKSVEIEIIRGQVSATVYGNILDEKNAYIQLYQFGEGTATEMAAFMDEFRDSGITGLVIDLRGNGGGYLDALRDIAGMFLPSGSVCIKQQFANGKVTESKTTGRMYENIKGIVILTDDSTASAAEALTMCLKELRDDVTILGTKTYGKGTVQISRIFDDGSALKYTTSKWLSPNGENINGTGITPDVELYLHDVLYHQFAGMEDNEEYRIDSVSDAVKDMQLSLDYLGYNPGRTDGYFSEATEEALKKYQSEHDMEADGVLNSTVYEALYSSVALDWNNSSDHDIQLQKAQEILNG